ncbi:MAG: DUF3800 domain-containing protein [bacterium]|nr:DUF3800 domain-containing protein [bacterium]
MSNKYFGFIDESGNSTQDRFFGLGLLIIDNTIGRFYDEMKSFYNKAFEIAKLHKEKRINELKTDNEFDQISQIANSTKRFELKFKYINFTNNSIYEKLIQHYFTFTNLRFCVLVIDRKSKEFSSSPFDPWDAYIHRAAMLLANNMKNISPCEICILADDISRPSRIKKPFEDSLQDSIKYRLNKLSSRDSIFGVARLESHSSLLLQIVDILLGAVMYDFKKEKGLISETLSLRQEKVVNRLRQILKVDSLVVNKTFHQPNYFSIWKLK